MHQDQLGNKFFFDKIPSRIVSIVPSQTEYLYDLGLENDVVAITKFCIYPEKWFQKKIKIGGTKKLNIEKIISLQPDLIIANKEENTKEDIEQLQNRFPVWISDINTLSDAFEMMKKLGIIFGKEEKSTEIIEKINAEKEKIKIVNSNKKVAYLIWNNPLMLAGKNTFIETMLKEAGYENIISENRYPEKTIDELLELNPDLIFLSSEPYPFSNKHVLGFKEKFTSAKIILVDGELFSWYGSKLIKSFSYFRQLNEEIFNKI